MKAVGIKEAVQYLLRDISHEVLYLDIRYRIYEVKFQYFSKSLGWIDCIPDWITEREG